MVSRFRIAASLGALSSVAACAGLPDQRLQAPLLTPAQPEALVSESDAGANDTTSTDTADLNNIQRRTPEVIFGDQTFFHPPQKLRGIETAERPAGGLSFTFRSAPIYAVVHEVLGEAFGLNYTIAPGVSGTISLRLDDVAGPAEAVGSLNAALELQNLEISELGGVYTVSRRGSIEAATGEVVFVEPAGETPTGVDLAVLQIRYAKLSDVTALAQTMLPNGIVKHTDDARGFVVLQGEPDEVSSAVDLFKSLDVNWLSSVSMAMLPIENAEPSEIAADLSPIVERQGGLSIIPIDRLATLLIVARGPESLEQVTGWVERLDQDARPTLTEDTLIYEARYVDASRLAAIAGAGRSGSSRSQYSSAGFDAPATEANLSVSSGGSSGLYQGLAVQVDSGRNAIIARGETEDLRSLRDLIEALDQPQRQVLIEATIVEVRLDENNQFGVQWDAVEDRVSATFTDLGSGAIASLFPGLSASYINTDVGVVVNALATTSDAEVVSSPRMLVLNNETARLQIGDQVPVITQSAVSIDDPGAPIVNSTSYRDTGVILSVTPSVRAGGMVEILVSQEVSGVSETTTSNIDSPTITQRAIESRLAVPDGATAVLGGLMETTRSASQTGVPILKDIPLAGVFFRSTGYVERRTELIVLIEPTVVHTVEPEIDIPSRLREALLRARSAGA